MILSPTSAKQKKTLELSEYKRLGWVIVDRNNCYLGQKWPNLVASVVKTKSK